MEELGDDDLMFTSLPFECLIECLAPLDVDELCSVAATCTALRDVAASDYLWRNLCVRERHGQRLDFNESLGTLSHPDAKKVVGGAEEPSIGRSTSASSSATPWREVYWSSRQTRSTTICIDTGRGYAKYGVASSARPSVLQICQPGAECSQETLYQSAFRKLGLRRADMTKHAMIIAEPFRLAPDVCERERAQWRYETERRVLQGYQVSNLCIVDSASLCLFANALTSGVVVNIGFGMTCATRLIELGTLAARATALLTALPAPLLKSRY
jgi:hypothetical protein